MLSPFSLFLLKQAIRNPLYLINPTVVSEADIALPRMSVIHYLDMSSDRHFPDENLAYFSDVPKTKKIPIQHITDLISTTETTVKQNKTVEREVRIWTQENIKRFKTINLLETPNRDTIVNSIFNYNLLKDLYNYKTSVISRHHQFRNLYLTYWNTVKLAINIDNTSHHFVRVDVPTLLPSFSVLNVVLNYDDTKFSRVITDNKLLVIIDIYRWLVDNSRNKSTMSEITDEMSNQIVLEFHYKGHVVFLPLSIIRSIDKDSKLESNVKVSSVKTQKMFLLMLRKFQDSVDLILSGDEPLPEMPDDLINDDGLSSDNITDHIDETSDTDTYNEPARPNEIIKTNIQKTSTKTLDQNEDTLLEPNSLTEIINSNISAFDEDDYDDFGDSLLETDFKESKEEPNETSPITIETNPEVLEKYLTTKTLDDHINQHIEDGETFKTMSKAEIRQLRKLREERFNLKSPYSPSKVLDDDLEINQQDKVLTKEKLKLDVSIPGVKDTMKEELLSRFDQIYLDTTYKKDVLSCVSHLEKSGIIIKDYQVEKEVNAVGQYEVHRLTLKPINGKESTVYFRLPMIDEEGEYIAAGIRYKMRKQRSPLPIVKISPTRVALTSNYGKLFIDRTERKASDPYRYIEDYIRKSYLDENGIVTKIVPGKSVNNTEKLPNLFQYLASHFKRIETKEAILLFDRTHTLDLIKPDVNEALTKEGYLFVGTIKDNHVLVMKANGDLYDFTTKEEVGSLYSLLDIDLTKIPKQFSTLKVLGDNIPLGVCLGYYWGLSTLISITNVTHQILPRGKRYTATSNDVVLRFSDYKLVLTSDQEHIRLLLNGFLFYKDYIKDYLLTDFNRKEVYLNILESRDASLLHLKELNSLETLFLDPITIDVLKDINEPTDFFKLLLRANELLSDFSHPDQNDPNYNRIRGYDRVPGLMYRALAESIREHNFKRTTKGKIELDPYKVWNYITQDSTVKITEDNNPITDIKEREIVTLSGADGLNKDATPAVLRRYHKNDIGLISEATIDSSDVGLNFYLSPYAKINSTRGMIDKEIKTHIEDKQKIFSTSALMAPMSDIDDPKRVKN